MRSVAFGVVVMRSLASLLTDLSGRRQDFFASVVVFLIALPLSMGIALASGAPVGAGLVAAAVGGMLVSAVGGAPFLVSGPAAGLAVLVFDATSRYGFPTVAAMVAACGVVQMVLAALQLGRFATAVAPSVLHGMMAGIGVLIVLSQSAVVLGHSPQKSAFGNLQALPHMAASLSWPSLALGALTAAVMLAWPRLPKKVSAVFPAPLAAVGLATAAAYFLALPVRRVALPEQLWQLQGLQLNGIPWLEFVGGALTMALVASTESLLSAVAVDKLHAGPRARLDRELFAQGMANGVSGLLGGLPITGVIVRSTANLQSGAKSALSPFLHGLWLVLAATFAGSLLAQVPLAALAALLIVTGLKLLNVKSMKHLHRHGELPVYAITLAGVVGVNLLAGIAAGLLACVLRLFFRLARGRVQVVNDASGRACTVTVQGVATFLLVPKLNAALQGIAQGTAVRIHLPVQLMDHTVQETLDAWRQQHEAQGGSTTLMPAVSSTRPPSSSTQAKIVLPAFSDIVTEVQS